MHKLVVSSRVSDILVTPKTQGAPIYGYAPPIF